MTGRLRAAFFIDGEKIWKRSLNAPCARVAGAGFLTLTWNPRREGGCGFNARGAKVLPS
nr:MAG TPA: hypothetical protein [Caudoviricetes sp.]